MTMRKKLSLNQSGIASIIVTVFLMLIISLIVLGFAKVTRREQRQSLDRQLNSQAFYAAESGVHDAQKYINDQLAAGTPLTPINTCTGPGSFASVSGVSNTIDTTTSYSCVLIDPAPGDLVWSYVDTGGSITFPLKPESGTLDNITISWQDPGKASPRPYSGGSCATNPLPTVLPPIGDWNCDAGLLRVDITPVNSLLRDELINKTLNLVLYPARNGLGESSVSYATIQASNIHGAMRGINCLEGSVPRDCNFTLTGLDAAYPGNTAGYYVRIRPIYRPATININGLLASAAGSAKLVGAQAVVDVTGKANDILKRLRVHVPVTESAVKNNTNFDFAIESVDTLCKAYGILPPTTVTNLSGTPDPSCAVP